MNHNSDATIDSAPFRSPRLNSLRARFILASLICLPLFVGASGLLLEQAFKESLLSSEKEQLQSQLYLLLGAAELQGDDLWLPEQLPEPRYETLNSGLYSQISTTDNSLGDNSWQVLWQSNSARLLENSLAADTVAFQLNRQTLTETQSLFHFTQDLQWLNNDNQALPLRFEIFHSRDTYQQQLSHYRQQLWYGLSLLTMALIAIQAVILSWGHRPLRKLAKDIRRMSSGNMQKLTGHYPDEIRPLTDNINDLIRTEQQQRERYKNTLGDLAHSLKTPLSILQGELQQSEQHPAIMQDQIARMRTIIQHQLQRAVLKTETQRHQSIAIEPIIQRLCSAMRKVYHNKNLTFDVQIPNDTRYPIESQDLFEMMGNLIENACKYGEKNVCISAYLLVESLIITVADDGSGIALPAKQTLLQRGARADTAKPGQGIGLAVTTDIISAYKGSLDITQSKRLGGAEFQVRLPVRH